MGINALRIEVCELIEHLTGDDVREVMDVHVEHVSTPTCEHRQEYRAYRFNPGCQIGLEANWKADSQDELLAKISETYRKPPVRPEVDLIAMGI